MIVDHPDGLHPGVDDNRAHELESALFEGFGNLFSQRSLGENLPTVLDRFAPREIPREGCEVISGRLHLHIDPRAVDGGFDLGARAHDSRILQQPLDVRFSKFGYLRRIEVLECLAEGIALAEDDDPGQAGLKSLQHEHFPKGAAVVLRDAPLLIVVGTVERVVSGPGTTNDLFRHVFESCNLDYEDKSRRKTKENREPE